MLSQFLKPKNTVFLETDQLANNLNKLTALFYQFTAEDNDSRRSEQIAAIDGYKNEVFKTVKLINEELNRNFLAPFDREDIYHFTSKLGEIANTIYGTGRRMINHDLKADDFSIELLARQLTSIIQSLTKAIKVLQQKQLIAGLSENCVAIDAQLVAFDEMVNEAMNNTAANVSAVELIKRNDILYMCDDLSKQLSDALNILESFIVKYQ